MKRLGMRVGTAWPRMAERMVMHMRAENAAVKTTRRGCFMAIRAAIRKVLSPISEKIIIVKESKKECSGWISEAGAEVSRGIDGVKGLRISSGSFLEEPTGAGWGMSWGLSGRSSGFWTLAISSLLYGEWM